MSEKELREKELKKRLTRRREILPSSQRMEKYIKLGERSRAGEKYIEPVMLNRIFQARVIAMGRDGRFRRCALELYHALLVLGERAFDFSWDARAFYLFGEVLHREHALAAELGFAPPLIEEFFRALRRELTQYAAMMNVRRVAEAEGRIDSETSEDGVKSIAAQERDAAAGSAGGLRQGRGEAAEAGARFYDTFRDFLTEFKDAKLFNRSDTEDFRDRAGSADSEGRVAGEEKSVTEGSTVSAQAATKVEHEAADDLDVDAVDPLETYEPTKELVGDDLIQSQLDGAVGLLELFLCAQLRSRSSLVRRIYRSYLGEICLHPGYEYIHRAEDAFARYALAVEIVREVEQLKREAARLSMKEDRRAHATARGGEAVEAGKSASASIAGMHAALAARPLTPGELACYVVDLLYAAGLIAEKAMFFDYAEARAGERSFQGGFEFWERFHWALVDLLELVAEAAQYAPRELREEIQTFFEEIDPFDESLSVESENRAVGWFFRDWLSVAPIDGATAARVISAARRLFDADVSLRFNYELIDAVLSYMGVAHMAGELPEEVLREVEALVDSWNIWTGTIFIQETEHLWAKYLAIKEKE